MKRIIGSIAAVVLALTLGVSAYAKPTAKQASAPKTTASAPKASTTKRKHKRSKRSKHTKRTAHYKMKGSKQDRAQAKSQEKVKKG